MRRVGRDVAEKGFILLSFDKVERFVEPDVRAIAFELFGDIVAPIDVVIVIVAPVVGCLTGRAASVSNRFLKTPVVRTKRVALPEMPFPE